MLMKRPRAPRPKLEFDRIQDAITLRVERRMDVRGAFVVYGKTDVYNVRPIAEHPAWQCDCGDHLWRERLCKHIHSVLIEESDPEALDLMMQVMRGKRSEPTLPKASEG